MILEIFQRAATSAEGRLQVEIARIHMLKTRMAGMGKDLAQQAFGVGARGPGEKKKEFELNEIDRFRYRTRYFTDSGIII